MGLYWANISRKTQKDRPIQFYQDGLFYGAVQKRILGHGKKKRHSKIVDSRQQTSYIF
jgi:hypothetical protein